PLQNHAPSRRNLPSGAQSREYKRFSKSRRIKMRYQLAPLYCRPWTLNGISARLIESHYENNYGGALNRLNAISEEIEQLDLSATSSQSLARLKRDEIV